MVTTTRDQVLAALADGPLTMRDVVSRCHGVTDTAVRSALRALSRAGQIRLTDSTGHSATRQSSRAWTLVGAGAPSPVPTPYRPGVFAGWDDGTVAELRRLVALGWSGSKIAAALGCRTRNQAIGKATRLGIFPRHVASAPQRIARPIAPSPKPPRPNSTPAPATSRVSSDGNRTYDMLPPVPLQPTTAFDVNPEAKPWMERRTFKDCAWPVGEPDRPANQLACCKPTGGALYCAAHTKIGGMKAKGYLSDKNVGVEKPRRAA